MVAGACSAGAGDVAVVDRPGPTPPQPSSPASPSTSGGTSTTAAAGSPGAAAATPAGTLDWQTCGRFQCAKLTVPLDYADPSKGTIDLYVKRRPAGNKDQRVGS